MTVLGVEGLADHGEGKFAETIPDEGRGSVQHTLRKFRKKKTWIFERAV